MSKYRQIDIKNLEQNFYIAFVENLHRQMMSEIMRAGIVPPEEIKLISAMVKTNYTAEINAEIQKFKTVSTSM